MTADEALRDLLQFARRHNLEEVVWKDDEVKVAFRRDAVPPPPPAAVSEQPVEETTPVNEDMIVRSPMVGTFRRAVNKDRPPLVMIGNHIKPGDRLGVVECMKIPTDVTCYCAGEIRQIMVEDGQTVEYGQPLFTVSATASENGSDQ
jgi:biotin carboxyl carrier protein